MPKVQHIVQTRFSMRRRKNLYRSRPWLEARLDLLGQFCLPSIAGQTSDNFIWALFCDEVTDTDVLSRLYEHEKMLPNLRVILTSTEKNEVTALDGIIDSEADLLITTRLDSDDALSNYYLEAVQEYALSFHHSGHRDLLVNFPHGYRLDARDGRLFTNWLPYSPFHSLLERPRYCEVQTVMHSGHARLHHQHPTQQDESLCRWLIVIHGSNSSSQIQESSPRAEVIGSELPDFSLNYNSFAPWSE